MSRSSSVPGKVLLAALVTALLSALVAQTAGAEAMPEAPGAGGGAAERGYVAVDATGNVATFGLVSDMGDLAGLSLNDPIVDVDATPTGRGYFMTASDGGVFTFGDAAFHGSTGAMTLDQDVVGIAATSSGAGYWLVAADGGVFAYGDAAFYGSTGGMTLNQPIVAIAPTASGEGYWMVASDGGVFTFGDAVFYGSAAGSAQADVVGMAPTASGMGYWIADSDGNVHSYGDAADPMDPAEQGIGGITVVSVEATADGGAWMFTDTGATYGLGSVFGRSVTAGSTTDGFVAATLVPDGDFTLTVLHNNDGESSLTPDGDVGGIAVFANTVNALRGEVTGTDGSGSILVSSGDNFLASAALSASFAKGAPWYDAIGLNHLDYDAYALGNHGFDFGPDRLAEFISGFDADRKFLSSNLTFENEPVLQAFVETGQIAKSTVSMVNGRSVGIIGATTPGLGDISSPRNTTIDPDVLGAVQAQADTLTAAGVDIIVLISHLQDVNADRAMVAELSNVDVVVAGGGDEVLANEGDVLAPGDEAAFPYPIVESDADGNDVPVVTTAGDYSYVGRLVVTFDGAGNLLRVEEGSGPVLVQSSAGADAFIQANVVDPVAEYEAGLAGTVIATTEVELDSDRGTTHGDTVGKRVQEVNLGNLFADALLWQAQQLSADFGVDSPQVAIQNGGGMRNASFMDEATLPYDITQLDTFDLAPFSNFVTVIEDLTPTELEDILEHAYGELPGSNGGFAQIAGMTVEVEFDPALSPGDGEPNPSVDVTDITIEGGIQVLVNNVAQAVTVDLVTIDFLAGGGDGYPIPEDADVTKLPASYQQALENFLSGAVVDGGLGGAVTAADYPEVPVGGGTRVLVTVL
ncbi:MAG: bifunctional metallophosphatase/5'-nucleotidase [Actinomycetia bacterium]|nr:bifunctional metallophosphatase/5'-nucleotidase [Actinomycetes bacterium]